MSIYRARLRKGR